MPRETEQNGCDEQHCNELRKAPSCDVPNFYVYIMASRSRVLYVGVTNDIRNRVWQHQHDELPGFTSKYRVHRLVYFERFQYVTHAIAREKEIKGWLRKKKIALIEAENPTWEDLSEEWYKKQILPLRQAQGKDEVLVGRIMGPVTK